MNIRNQGITANTCFCTSSIGAGFRRCISHMVMPSRIGSTPIARNTGGVKGRRPNRLTGVSGSGADRSFSHSTKGWCRISTDNIRFL